MTDLRPDVQVLVVESGGSLRDTITRRAQIVDQVPETVQTIRRGRLIAIAENPAGLVVTPAPPLTVERDFQLRQILVCRLSDSGEFRDQRPQQVGIDLQKLTHTGNLFSPASMEPRH
ncbi:hypothetical protein [Nocardia sp. NBC_00403]|uniref:hypothetical protein n=1 Tax=Nocardia sp. NBC_00403 TaxID=2975990 RepID=UPI002E1E0F68